MPDDGDVVHSVIVQGPHGPYRSTYTMKAVRRFFTNANDIAKSRRNQERRNGCDLRTTNTDYRKPRDSRRVSVGDNRARMEC